VLLDRHGVPVTRCASGDPLGQPSRYDKEPKFQGKNWDGFRPAAIWVIEPAKGDIPDFVMVDIDRHRGGSNDTVITYFQVGRGGVYVVRPLPQGHQVPPGIGVDSRRPWPDDPHDPDSRGAHQANWQQPQNGQEPARAGQHQQRPAGVGDDLLLPLVQHRWLDPDRSGRHQPVTALVASPAGPILLEGHLRSRWEEQ